MGNPEQAAPYVRRHTAPILDAVVHTLEQKYDENHEFNEGTRNNDIWDAYNDLV